jgi:hypothetical protein
MPFSVNSILLYFFMKSQNINVSGFCDNNEELHLKQFKGSKILLPDAAFSENSDITIMLSEIRFFDEMTEQLKEIGFNSIWKFTDYHVDFDIRKYTDILTYIEEYPHISPVQARKATQLKKSIPILKTWQNLILELKDEYSEPYYFEEESEQQELINLNNSPRFLVCVNSTEHVDNTFLAECAQSLTTQKYRNFTVLPIYSPENEKAVKSVFSNVDYLTTDNAKTNIECIEFIRAHFNDYDKYNLIITVGGNDKLSTNALAKLANEAENKQEFVFTANEDRIYGNEFISPYYKYEYQKNTLINSEGLIRNLVCVRSEFNEDIKTLDMDRIYIINEVLYHYRVLDTIHDNKIKAIAFYLPQFHAIPENNKWWGEGFTEWTNVKRAYPLFDGHYQPHVPGELGYYDLINDKDIQKKQAELAVKHGIYGFCYYYYWFNGKRLLEKPFNNILNNPELNMPFCICWANENWTRRWDGMENEILMGQEHTPESDEKFIYDVLPILKDKRYITVNGAPILLIYRCDLFPDFKKTVSVWRKVAEENGLPHIHISTVKSPGWTYTEFDTVDCDSVTEFPPHKSYPNLITKILSDGDDKYMWEYKGYVARAMNRKINKRLHFRGAMVNFDNTARRLKDASIFLNSTPEEYKKLLVSLVDFTSRYKEEERLIFINAWNEWAEGNHLEPDEKFGDHYLKATKEALEINC